MNIISQIFTPILIQPLLNGLILCYKLLWSNLGLAIIVFTVVLRFILQPLTKPYMESMKRIKEFQPHLDKLKKKYEGDQKGFMQAQAEFYKQNNINPGAGCLPYLLQIVVLIALFNVFTTTLKGTDDINKINNLLYQPLKFSQEAKINTSFLYLNLTKPDTFNVGLPFSIPGPFLILSAILQFISAKMMAPVVATEKKIAKKTKDTADDASVAMQSSMVYTFPLFTLIFGMSFPSGLALYWMLFSLMQAIQQYQSTGWGGLTPFISRLNLLKSKANDKK